MKAIIVALSLFGMAYAGGYGLETLGGKGGYGLGLISLGSLGGKGYDDGSYREAYYGGDDGSYKGGYDGGDDGSYKGGYEGAYDGGYGKGLELRTVEISKAEPIVLIGKNRDEGFILGGGDLELGGDIRHGQYSPMPRQQIKLVGVPVPVKKPVPVPVDKPYTVKIDKPYPVKIERIEKKPYVAKVIRPVIEKTIHVQEHKSYH